MPDVEEVDRLGIPAEGKAFLNQLANVVQSPQRSDCEFFDLKLQREVNIAG
jgi:hypothetical protein